MIYGKAGTLSQDAYEMNKEEAARFNKSHHEANLTGQHVFLFYRKDGKEEVLLMRPEKYVDSHYYFDIANGYVENEQYEAVLSDLKNHGVTTVIAVMDTRQVLGAEKRKNLVRMIGNWLVIACYKAGIDFCDLLITEKDGLKDHTRSWFQYDDPDIIDKMIGGYERSRKKNQNS